MNRIVMVLFLAVLTLSAGCGSSKKTSETGREDISEQNRARLARDMQRLQSFSLELKSQSEEMRLLQATVGLKKRDHYTSDEHDKIENLLFRYLACRESLWEIVNYYRDYRDRFPDKRDQVRGFITGFDAALHLAYYSSLLVATFIDEDAVIDKLNEEYYRSDIPRGTYDRLLESLTKIENIEALKTAWELYSAEMSNRESLLYGITESEPAYRQSASRILSLYDDAEIRIQYILQKKSLLLPDVNNRLRHSAIVKLAQKAVEDLGDNLYAARGILFVNVSRLKSPVASNVKFRRDQIAQMRGMLRPGDVILTFSSGYMSNIFLPGKFKHGITYVGLPGQRKAAGLGGEAFPGLPGVRIDKFKNDLEKTRLDSGHDADLIEAVAEGVIFNSLEEITNEHIARLCVLRPNLDRNTLRNSLETIFLLLGDHYDFKFDFIDASNQCCTEVIYRALHKHGPVEFDLTKRMGVWTLCADDIVNYYLSSSGGGAFDFVLYAEENPDSVGNAVILTDAAGKARLATLMNGD